MPQTKLIKDIKIFEEVFGIANEVFNVSECFPKQVMKHNFQNITFLDFYYRLDGRFGTELKNL